MPSLFLISRLPGMKKLKNRVTIINAGNASSLPTLGVAPELSHRLQPGTYKNINDHPDERHRTCGRRPSFDFTSTGKDSTLFPPQTQTAVSELPPPVVSCSIQHSHCSVEPAPSRVARKVSKVGSNIVSDVIAGGASLLEGIRRSRQGEALGSDQEQMEKLGDMGIISTHSVAADGLDSEAGEKCWIGGYAEGQSRHHPHPSAASTKGIMKKPTTCPEIQKRASRQTMNPKMVDPKPSVRFTLDLPPTLALDLSSSGSGLDIGRKTTPKEVHTMPSLGSWAERTAAALLNKSRDVAHVGDAPTLNAIGSESATVLCPIKSGISAAERDQGLQDMDGSDVSAQGHPAQFIG